MQLAQEAPPAGDPPGVRLPGLLGQLLIGGPVALDGLPRLLEGLAQPLLFLNGRVQRPLARLGPEGLIALFSLFHRLPNHIP